MIVLPAPDERSARALRSYMAQRALAERGTPMEAAIASGMANQLGKRFGIVELAVRAYVPDPCTANVAYDGISLMAAGVPWWRGMLAVAALDRVGALHDQRFEVSDADSPWEFDPAQGEAGDFVIHVIGVERIIGLVTGIIAAVTLRLACADASRRLRAADPIRKALMSEDVPAWKRYFASRYAKPEAPRNTPEDSLAWFLGGISGVIQALTDEQERRAAGRRAWSQRTALVKWTPPDSMFRADVGEIDMHAPDAHESSKALPRKPVIIDAVTDARKREDAGEQNGMVNLFRAGAKDGADTTRRMLRGY